MSSFICFIQGLWIILKTLLRRNKTQFFRATVCFLFRGEGENKQILLAEKKHKIGKGCLNGYGGKVEPGERPVDAACRELIEESGGVEPHPDNMEEVAVITFCNTDRGHLSVYVVHFYFLKSWEGEPLETKDMGRPQWFGILDIPFRKLMPGDEFVLIPILRGKRIKGSMVIDLFAGKVLLRYIR